MRLDCYLQAKEYFDSRNKASEAVKRGEIYVDGVCIKKPSFEICENSTCKIQYRCSESYVSLGGYKLKKALTDFNFCVEGLIVADIGASTGGFTDCLLKNGASKVYSVDLNGELLHSSLKKNPKVVTIIKNAKELKCSDFNDKLDLICADLSFISAAQVLGIFYDLISDNSNIILLIKPQFEMGKKLRLKNGIIRDDKIRMDACKSVFDFAVSIGFNALKITNAPISENKNIEYLILLRKSREEQQPIEKIFIK